MKGCKQVWERAHLNSQSALLVGHCICESSPTTIPSRSSCHFITSLTSRCVFLFDSVEICATLEESGGDFQVLSFEFSEESF
ncbi:hypothetical protein L1887_16283 [Cichorium endivia]|nr:hypothetical protein L1887_16283 [Cichorium endivia]